MSRHLLRLTLATMLLTSPALAQEAPILRANDQRGINVFETPKVTRPYTGTTLQWGGGFTQQFQSLSHGTTSSSATPLVKIGNGFNNAVANLDLTAYVAKGLTVKMTQYLSSRHHNESWVKDGYFQIDAAPFNIPVLNAVMERTTIKAGHMEINYGDAHFRRTDNGQAMFNPLVGNYIMDAFTTEIGTEVYVRPIDGVFVMGGIFAGESKGMVQKPEMRSEAFLGKIGVDKQLSEQLRVRLTGSAFSQAQATNQTLYAGDRAGSRYYSVVETSTDEKSAFTSGAINPGFNSIHAYVVNPFIKYRGLELFGNFETANGRARGENATRTFTQRVYEGTYRFLGDKAYLSARQSEVDGTIRTGATPVNTDVAISRSQLGGGWFINKSVLLKAEWVDQSYDKFPAADIRNGAWFKGYVVEGVVSF